MYEECLIVLERDLPHAFLEGKVHEGFLFVGVFSSPDKAKATLVKAGFVTAELQSQFRMSRVTCDDDLFRARDLDMSSSVVNQPGLAVGV